MNHRSVEEAALKLHNQGNQGRDTVEVASLDKVDRMQNPEAGVRNERMRVAWVDALERVRWWLSMSQDAGVVVQVPLLAF